MGWKYSSDIHRRTTGILPYGYQEHRKQEEDSKKWSSVLRPVVVGNHVIVQRQKNSGDGVEILHIDIFTRDGDLVQMDIESPTNFIYAADDELYAIDNAPVVAGELNPHIVVYRLKGVNGS